MRKLIATLGITAAVTLAAAAPASAAMTAYMTLKSTKGVVQGSVTQKGRQGTIAVIATSHEITSPRDPASGMPTGKRQHKPFVITKELDKSTPILRSILVKNENIPELVLRFYAPKLMGATGVGTEVNHFTVKLTDASIANIKHVLPNVKYPDTMKFENYEEIAFTYRKIEWTWTDGGITSEDEWEVRR